MARIALFQPDTTSHARLVGALKEHHHLVECESWSEIWEQAASQPPDACIVDPYNSFDPVSLPEILHFRRRFPATALVVYGDFTGREMDLYYLGRLGVDGVILANREMNIRGLRTRVEIALSTWLAKRVADALGERIPRLGVRCIEWAVAHAEDGPQVKDLARAMRISPRALSRELRTMDLPSPRHILLWGRLFQAARMLEATEITVEEVAFRLGYATSASLGRAFRENLDLSPTDLLEAPDGVERVLEGFLATATDGEWTHGRDWRRQPSSADHG